jgi:RNA polymerase sigma-70 factor (ECF subfamily)
VNDDSHLIQAALAGNRDAFGELVARYQPRLYGVLVYVTGCTAEAEDVAQETFLLALRHLGQFRQRSAFYTWLYRIALNQCASRRRRRRPDRLLDGGPDGHRPEPVDPADSPERRVERNEQIELVRRAVHSLEDPYRTILVLREMEGCDYEQIGEMLEIPAGTVRSRLHRARLQLRAQLRQLMSQEIR